MRLRRELRLLRAYAAINTLVLVVLATAAFRQTSGAPQKFDQISVHRIDVVDDDGTLRMVISNKDHMHPGVIEGRTIDRQRRVAGILFFNDRGDEDGGVTYTGREVNGIPQADAGLNFDQYRQDQTIGIGYTESGGRRSAALRVWDRPDTGLGEMIDKVNAANKLTDRAARDAELAKIRAAAPPAPQRIFVGKNADRAALVSLADANGKPRLTLTVDPNGNPRIEFLDESGKVTARVPQ
jgi:hypothetical protein